MLTMEELVEVAAWEEVVDEELHVGSWAEAFKLHQISVLHGSERFQFVFEASFGLQARPELLHCQGGVLVHLELVHHSIATLSDDVVLADESQCMQHLLRSGHIGAPLEHDYLPTCCKVDFDMVVLPHPAHDENHCNYEFESEKQSHRQKHDLHQAQARLGAFHCTCPAMELAHQAINMWLNYEWSFISLRKHTEAIRVNSPKNRAQHHLSSSGQNWDEFSWTEKC